MRQSFYDRNHVPIHPGQARFVDEHSVSVDGATPITAKYFVIASGTRPYRPPDVDFSHPYIFDSDTILDITYNNISICPAVFEIVENMKSEISF